jgi:hypothetical protein
MTITFDADAFRSTDFHTFMTALVGAYRPIQTEEELADAFSYDICEGCHGKSLHCLVVPDWRSDCGACLNDALRLRGFTSSDCHTCGGLLGIQLLTPGTEPDTYHVHMTPLSGGAR